MCCYWGCKVQQSPLKGKHRALEKIILDVYPGGGVQSVWQNRGMWSSPPHTYTSKYTSILNNSHKIPAECWQTILNTQNHKRNLHTPDRMKEKKAGVGVDWDGTCTPKK